MGETLALRANFNLHNFKAKAIQQFGENTNSKKIFDDLTGHIIKEVVEEGRTGLTYFETRNEKKQQCILSIDKAFNELGQLSHTHYSACTPEEKAAYKQKFEDVITLCRYLERDWAITQGGPKFTNVIRFIRYNFEAHLSVLEGKTNVVTAGNTLIAKLDTFYDTNWAKIKDYLSGKKTALFAAGAGGTAAGIVGGVEVAGATGILAKAAIVIKVILAALAAIGVHGAAAAAIVYAAPAVGVGAAVGLAVGGGYLIYRHHQEAKALERLTRLSRLTNLIQKQTQLAIEIEGSEFDVPRLRYEKISFHKQLSKTNQEILTILEIAAKNNDEHILKECQPLLRKLLEDTSTLTADFLKQHVSIDFSQYPSFETSGDFINVINYTDNAPGLAPSLYNGKELKAETCSKVAGEIPWLKLKELDNYVRGVDFSREQKMLFHLFRSYFYQTHLIPRMLFNTNNVNGKIPTLFPNLTSYLKNNSDVRIKCLQLALKELRNNPGVKFNLDIFQIKAVKQIILDPAYDWYIEGLQVKEAAEAKEALESSIRPGDLDL